MLTSGVDRSFSVLSFKDSGENLRVVPPIPQEQIVILAKNDRLLLSWSDSHVKLWKLEEVRTLESDGEDQIGIRFLLEMQLSVFPCLPYADNRRKKISLPSLYPQMVNIS